MGGGPRQRQHPLTKLALMPLAFAVGQSAAWPWLGLPRLPWALAALLFAALLAEPPPTRRRALAGLALSLPLLGSLLAMHGLFQPGSTVLWAWPPLQITAEGLRFGARAFGRVLPVAVATLLLFLTTDPADLTLALTEAGLPHEAAYVLLAALHLLPRLQARAAQIQAAQQARGLRVDGPPWQRLRALLPLATPLITAALHESEERALALEARAFRAPGPKSSWRCLRDSPAQRLARWAMLAAALAALLL